MELQILVVEEVVVEVLLLVKLMVDQELLYYLFLRMLLYL
jgi:hypothetical protein